MKFGICGTVELAPLAAEAGFDYLESSVANMLAPAEPEEVFEEKHRIWSNLPLPVQAFNGFIPATIRLSGPDARTDEAVEYASTALRRASSSGIRTIVFGSGNARKVPEGWDHERAFAQVADFLRGIAPVAEKYDVCVVVEPLRKLECNLINSVQRGAELAMAAGSSHIQLLVDGFHWATEEDTEESLLANAAMLRHAHLATLPNRRMPGEEEYDFVPFFRALHRAGYKGRVSVEGSYELDVETMRRGLAILRDACSEAAR